nr:LysE/ArgO family amino acid transporter [Microbacterium bovistercoris]
MLASTLAGLGLGLSLIIAIGAQNLFVLRQGVRRAHVLPIVLVCTASDAVLIVLGVSGIGLALHAIPWLTLVVRIAGAVFLAGYAVLAVRRAWRPSGDALRVIETPGTAAAAVPAAQVSTAAVPTTSGSAAPRPAASVPAASIPAAQVPVATAPAGPTRTGLAAALATCLALTWLNPHVYLDTVFLLGSIASTHGADRWWFALGAVTGSALWFFALGYGSRLLGRWLASARAWRILDAVIAVIMLALAVNLLRGV